MNKRKANSARTGRSLNCFIFPFSRLLFYSTRRQNTKEEMQMHHARPHSVNQLLSNPVAPTVQYILFCA